MAKQRDRVHGATGIADPPRSDRPKRGASRTSPRLPAAAPPSGNQNGTDKTPGRPGRRIALWICLALAALAVVAVIALVAPAPRRPPRNPLSPPPPGGIPLSPEEVALQQEIAQSPRDPAPWRKLGEMYLIQAQPFEAVWAFREALDRGPGDVPTLRKLAGSLESARLSRPAIDTLSAVVRRAPEDLEARASLARLYLEVGEAKPAIATLRGAASGAPRRQGLASWPEGLLELGRARQLGGDMPGAIATYRAHMAVAPDSVEGSIRLARALLEKGQLDPARRVLEHGRMSAPRDPRFPFYLGLSWIQEGHPQKPERAMEHFKEAFIVAPDHPLPHHYVGLLLSRQGRWPEAQAHFLKATQADPTYADAQLQFARSLEKTGDAAAAKEQLGVYHFLKNDSYQAAEAFRAMVKADPKNVQAPRLVSLAYLRLGRNDLALRETKAALQRHPRDVTLLERLATLYILTHSRPPARRACEEWLKVQPGAARAYWLLGRVAQDDLKVTEAIQQYERAVAADPANAEYAVSLASVLNDAGGPENLRRAVELLRQAVSRDPENVSYRRDLGMALQQSGDLEGARRHFLAALDRNAHDAPTYSSLSQLCVRLQKPAMGRYFGPLVRAAQDRSREQQRVSRRVGQHPTSPEAHYDMAQFLMRTAAFPTAQSHLERALALRPNYPEARAALGHVKRVISVR